MSQVFQTPEQQSYLVKLLGYDYTIQYHPGTGTGNATANALSRHPSSGLCLTLSIPNFTFLEQLHTSLHAFAPFTNLMQQVQANPQDHQDFAIHRDLLFYKGKIWLSQDHPFVVLLLEEFQTSPLGGHMGVTKTINRLQDNFYQTGMCQYVKAYITKCLVCQQTKYETCKPTRLRHPLPILAGIWEDLSLDFIFSLPESQGFSIILVVVDRYSKGSAHFDVLSPRYTTYEVVLLFLDLVCKLHRFPKSLVSDRDPMLISSFWRELFRLSGTELKMSTLYHPEIDDQTEVLN